MAAVRKTSSESNKESEAARELRRELGKRLKGWREAKGQTQADLAQMLDLKYYSFVSQVENGLGRMPQDLVARWADALDVDRETFSWTLLEHVEPGIYAGLAHHDPTKNKRTASS